jgi:hypothetical protein
MKIACKNKRFLRKTNTESKIFLGGIKILAYFLNPGQCKTNKEDRTDGKSLSAEIRIRYPRQAHGTLFMRYRITELIPA